MGWEIDVLNWLSLKLISGISFGSLVINQIRLD